MGYIKKISIVIVFLLVFNTVAFSTDAKFVGSVSEKPKFSIFSIFNFNRKPKEPPSIETTVTHNADEFTALDGMLTVLKNTPREGSLNSTVPGVEIVVFAIETPPTKGEVTITDSMTGDFTYTPFTDQVGDDSFVFSAANETYGVKTATVSVTITENGEESPEPSPTETPGEESPSPSPTDEASPSPSPTAETSPSPAPTQYSFRYEDMIGHWGETSAIKLADINVIRGFKIGARNFFYPESELTRGDFILYLVSALGLDVSPYSEISSPFADAQETPAWMNLQAKAAYDAGIIKGSEEDGKLYLRANDRLTRLEAIAMLNNTIKPDVVSVGNPDYTDMYLVPQWGVTYIKNMTGYGLLRGYADGTVRPYARMTRAQAAEMLNQTLMYKAENPEIIQELKQEMDKNMMY
ncbi:MAG: Cellulosome-anchoring protein precursor [Firmicutes bacterium ADurb.Bin193]|nr:MAG: Cellulosome-anchoring protein precursor [Firmicutes bacterium ADurb.Bin193]